MKLKQKLAIGLVSLGIAGHAYFAQPRIGAPEPAFGPAPALARKAASYDASTDPFVADAGIKAITKKAKSGSPLESAKKLHELMNVNATGGLKLSSSGSGTRDDRPPRTAAETLKLGGDCSDHANFMIAAMQEMGVQSGIVILDLGGGLMHILPYAQIGDSKHIVDSQSDEFGMGAVEVKGQRLEFTYEQVRENTSGVRFFRESPYPLAGGSYHVKWGNHLKGLKGKEKEALAAFTEALRRDPQDSYAAKQVDNIKGRLVNKLVQQAMTAYNKAEIIRKKAQKTNDKAELEKAVGIFKQAADLFEEAILFYPKSGGKDNLIAVLEGAAVCRFNSGGYGKAAEHYEALYRLTKDEKYKAEAEGARKKAKE